MPQHVSLSCLVPSPFQPILSKCHQRKDVHACPLRRPIFKSIEYEWKRLVYNFLDFEWGQVAINEVCCAGNCKGAPGFQKSPGVDFFFEAIRDTPPPLPCHDIPRKTYTNSVFIRKRVKLIFLCRKICHTTCLVHRSTP